MRQKKIPDQSIEELNSQIIQCRKCPRLVEWREQVARIRRKAYRDQDYWGKPVPGFGDISGKVLVIGLAPGAHGSNRTGRMFTGDRSGEFLFQALHQYGYSTQSVAVGVEDGLSLDSLFISAVCRCVPPGNKPLPEEIQNCLPYLEAELEMMTSLRIIVALGKVAFDTSMKILRNLSTGYEKSKFSHGVMVSPVDALPILIGSYHPSQQNTQTGRLTYEMFIDIWEHVRKIEESTLF